MQIQGRKNSLKIKFVGRIFLGRQGHTRRDIPTKTLCKLPFSVVLEREWLGCPRIWVGDLGRDVPDLENFMQEDFGLSFFVPTLLQ